MTTPDEADRHPFHHDDPSEDAIFLTPSSPSPVPTVIRTAETCDKSWLDLRTDGSTGPGIDLWSTLWEWARFRLEHGDDEWTQWRASHHVQLLTVWIHYEPKFDDAESSRVEGVDGRYVASLLRGSRRLVHASREAFLAEAHLVLTHVQHEVELLSQPNPG